MLPSQPSQTSQHQQSEQMGFSNDLLPPANPIMSKAIEKINQKVTFKLDPLKAVNQLSQRKQVPLVQKEASFFKQASRKEPVVSSIRKKMGKTTLCNAYEPSTMLFLKYDNRQLNRRGKIEYQAGLFIPFSSKKIPKLPDYRGMLFEDHLVFDSNYQSSNLMAVYKVDECTYDLILQNDINTKGFTQWFNFKVNNKKTNFIAKFNIVNLYKSKSLYSMGMKPVVRSEKSDKNNKRVWRRRGMHIYYDKNDINYEDNDNLYYKTLSFAYDFTIENDVVQFAHCFPYDLSDLKRLLQSIKDHPKVTISSLGTTIMGKPIPMIKISSVDQNKKGKKALVILGRQHPGQTPGSFLAQQIVLQLLRISNQVEFLAWRYDIYIFPMVNIDGVFLGNYRGNFAGFDLNRCWLRTDPDKQPEVFLIKNMIKKIAKKQQIELIIDLHGHSRKQNCILSRMGSFFYGNDYGNNYMLFPYIASKSNINILFEDSKFTHESESDAKFSTARVVLGNLIKEGGGNVYTYEVSFYGHYKENSQNAFSFNEEHYKQLGKSLVLSIYRTYLEIYKEQKTLKESVYLKNIKGQLTEMNAQNKDKKNERNSQSGSDSEAEKEVTTQIVAIQQFLQESKHLSNELSDLAEKANQKNLDYSSQEMEEDETVVIKQYPREFKQVGLPVERYNQEIKRKIQNLMDKNLENDLRSIIADRFPKLNSHNKHLKSQKSEQSLRGGSLAVNHSALMSKSPQIVYLDYLKSRTRQKQCESKLKIYGANCEFLGRPKAVSSFHPINEPQQSKDELNYQNSPIVLTKKVSLMGQKERTSKSYQTIELNGYLGMNSQEKDLIDKKPYFQRRKLTANHYLVRQKSQSIEGMREYAKQSLDELSKKTINVQSIEIKTPVREDRALGGRQSPLNKSNHSRLKLPSI